MSQLLDAVAWGVERYPDIVISRVDAERYKDIFAHFDCTTLPCLFFFPKHDKSGIEYTGERDDRDIIHAIHHHNGAPGYGASGAHPHGRYKPAAPEPWEQVAARIRHVPYEVERPPHAPAEHLYLDREEHFGAPPLGRALGPVVPPTQYPSAPPTYAAPAPPMPPMYAAPAAPMPQTYAAPPPPMPPMYAAPAAPMPQTAAPPSYGAPFSAPPYSSQTIPSY